MTRALAPALVAVLVGAGAAGASPQWSTPSRLSTSARAIGPELAVSPSGRAIVVWDREEGADCATSPASLGCVHIVTSRSRSAGWEGELEVNRPGVGAAPRAAVNDAGNEALIWVHDIGADRVLQAVFRPSSSVAFPNAEDLSKEVQEVRGHPIGVDSAGNLVAVWTQRRGGRLTVETVWHPRGAAWSAASTLSTPGADATFGPVLKVNPAGDAVTAWVESGFVMAATGDVPAATWARPQALSPLGGVGPADPAVAIDDAGDALVAWTRADLVLQAAYRAAGHNWEPAVTLGRDNGGVPPQSHAALDGAGNPTVVWVGGTGRTSLEAANRASTGAWKTSTIVPSGASEPDLAVDPEGRAVVVWRNDGTRRIEASIRPGAAAAWQPRVFVSPADPRLDAVDASGPRVGIDESGRAIAVWQRGTGQVAVETADLGGSWAPTLANTRRPEIRGLARAGRMVTCKRGAWEGTLPIRYAYRWLRNTHVIKGERRSVYRVRRRDVGARLACRVDATNAARTLGATSAPVLVRR